MNAYYIFAIFLSVQALLMSWYLPKRIRARMQYIFTNYPFSDYPDLYGGDIEKTKTYFRRYVIFNNCMLALGALIVVGVIYFGNRLPSAPSAMIAFGYGMIQAIPIMLMDFIMLKHCKKLRDDKEATQRSATLTRRSLFNHTSMSMVMVVITMYLAASLFDMYTKNFDLSLGFELFESLAILTVVNVFFAFIIRWRVYGKKVNPLMTAEDNKKDIDAAVHSTLFISIAASIFFISMRAVNVYDLEQFEGVLMSIYMQAIFCFSIIYSLNQNAIEDINFEGYRSRKA